VEAVKQASWVLSSNGVVDDAELRQILAKGVTIAARRGERELYDLTLAACRYWFRSPESKRPAHLRLVEIDPARSSSRN
jgi:hypothetical protein